MELIEAGEALSYDRSRMVFGGTVATIIGLGLPAIVIWVVVV